MIKKLILRFRNKFQFSIEKIKRFLMREDKTNTINIVPHEGIGDLISIVSALKYLCEKKFNITLITDAEKWNQIKDSFEDVPELSIINYISDGYYVLPRDIINKLSGKTIFLGHYSRFPIVQYPLSFYWQIGVRSNLAKCNLKVKAIDTGVGNLKDYIFIDLNTSRGKMCDIDIDSKENYVKCLSNTEILIKDSKVEKIVDIGSESSFRKKINIAINAKKIICSDAGLYNALIRLERRPEMIVYTRNHIHTHDQAIYGDCKFDGGVHIYRKLI